MLTTPAFAQSAGGIAEGGFGLLPIIFVMVIFYFLLIRPQQKRAKQHKEMLAAIRRGDKIVTSGGLMGTVVKVIDDNDTVEVELPDGKLVEGKTTYVADTVTRLVQGQQETTYLEVVIELVGSGTSFDQSPVTV